MDTRDNIENYQTDVWDDPNSSSWLPDIIWKFLPKDARNDLDKSSEDDKQTFD
jgi:hypothetical protein